MRHTVGNEPIDEYAAFTRAHPPQSAGDYGFSVLELDRAGLSESRARALGLPIDGTRHSALRDNVRHLKSYAE